MIPRNVILRFIGPRVALLNLDPPVWVWSNDDALRKNVDRRRAGFLAVVGVPLCQSL